MPVDPALHVVEGKSYPGRIEGDSVDWTWGNMVVFVLRRPATAAGP